jgi:hypothetical protein
MNASNTSNTQTPDQDCLSPSDSYIYAYAYAYETNQTQTHTLLNKRYEELRTQILELGPLESLGSHSPLSTSTSTSTSPSTYPYPYPSPSPSSATQRWDQWERKSGQIGEEFNIITQQGMASWFEVWLELKPIIRAGACDGDRNIDSHTHTHTHTDTAGDVNVHIGTGSIENENRYKIRNSGMILDYPGALVGVLSDMVLNAVNVAHLNNKYKLHNT